MNRLIFHLADKYLAMRERRRNPASPSGMVLERARLELPSGTGDTNSAEIAIADFAHLVFVFGRVLTEEESTCILALRSQKPHTRTCAHVLGDPKARREHCDDRGAVTTGCPCGAVEYRVRSEREGDWSITTRHGEETQQEVRGHGRVVGSTRDEHGEPVEGYVDVEYPHNVYPTYREYGDSIGKSSKYVARLVSSAEAKVIELECKP